MAGIITCFLAIILNVIFCGAQEAVQPPDPLPTTRDPYANVLSQLSDVIFDVEDRLYKLAAPKQESENLRTLSNEDKDNRRRNYFDRIRDNYKSLQDQVSESFSSGGVIKMADILNMNFQNKGARSSLDLSLPFLPLNIKVDAKKPPAEETYKDTLKLHSQLPDVSGNIDLGLPNIFNTETSDIFKNKQNNVKPELQKRSSRPIRSASTANKKIRNQSKSSAKLNVETSKSNNVHRQDWEDESVVQERILSDILFSESTFDKYFRQFLKGPSKWLLDSANILPPKKIIENIRDATRNQFSASTSKSVAQIEKSGVASNDKKEPKFRRPEQSESLRHDAESRIVLVFTSEGVPLKLKIDPRVKKPLKFLHKILSEAKVSLNIPVSTTKGIQPAGNGVLHLGYEESGMPSRTPVLDLADDNQLSYLLRALKKFQSQY